MKKVNEFITFNKKGRGNEIVFNIKLIHKIFKSKPINILNYYYLVLVNYFNYCDLSNDTNFIKFLKYNVKNNTCVNDYLIECSDYKADTDSIYFKTASGEDELPLLGLFIINDKYYCYALASCILVENTNTNEKFVYFCD